MTATGVAGYYVLVKAKLPVLFLLLIVLGLLIHYGDLSEPGISTGDEALTALRARGMIEQGHWWTPYWDGQVNLHKPPLYYWFVAIGYKVLGESLLAVRLPSVIAFLVLLGLMYRFGRTSMDAWAGILAALVLAVHPTMLTQSRLGMMDTSLILMYMLGGWFLWRAAENPRSYLWWGACCGCAFLLKGGGAILWLPASLVYLLIANRNAFKRTSFYYGLLTSILVPGVWVASQLIMHNEEFMVGFFEHGISNRVQHNVFASFGMHKTSGYLWQSLGGLAPLAIAAPFLLLLPRCKRPVFLEWKLVLYVYALGVSAYVLTNMMERQLYWYILPMVTCMAFALGCVLWMALCARGRATIVVVVCLLLVAGTFVRGAYTQSFFVHMVRILGLSTVVAVCFLPARKISWKPILLLTITAAIVGGLSPSNKRVNLAQVRDSSSFERLAKVIPPPRERDDWLIVNFKYYQMNSALFYTRRNSIRLKRLCRHEVQPGDSFYGIVDGEEYNQRLGGLEVNEIAKEGKYTAIVVSNATDAAIICQENSRI